METKQEVFSSFYVSCESKEYFQQPTKFKSLMVRVPEIMEGWGGGGGAGVGVCGSTSP